MGLIFNLGKRVRLNTLPFVFVKKCSIIKVLKNNLKKQMLQYKTFKLEDDKGINELLENNLLAGGVSIAVSNGEICIPFNDGRPMNKGQKIIDLKGQLDETKQKQETILFGTKVNEKQLDGASKQLNEMEANLAEIKGDKGKEVYTKKTKLEEIIKRLKGTVDQMQIIDMTNKSELTRMDIEMEVLEGMIKEIE